MAPPTTLAIKTSAVSRLIKEESMYHKELVVEQKRLEKMEADTENCDEYAITQQKKVVEETKSVVPPVREKLKAAIEVLEFQLQSAPASEPAENKEKASKAIEDGKNVLANE
ncbi:tubulin binding cofactor A-domain-containing protein [Trichophaea hybrida]|nr:tubulin binding cofactor A-domain-containing protein [Trichophaea hybrida]